MLSVKHPLIIINQSIISNSPLGTKNLWSKILSKQFSCWLCQFSFSAKEGFVKNVWDSGFCFFFYKPCRILYQLTFGASRFFLWSLRQRQWYPKIYFSPNELFITFQFQNRHPTQTKECVSERSASFITQTARRGRSERAARSHVRARLPWTTLPPPTTHAACECLGFFYLRGDCHLI